MSLSVVIPACGEERYLGRTLSNVQFVNGQGLTNADAEGTAQRHNKPCLLCPRWLIASLFTQVKSAFALVSFWIYPLQD